MSEKQLTQEEQQQLLQLARNTILSYLRARRVEKPLFQSEVMNKKGGAFVTLHKQGALRGCIGTFRSDKPLVDIVQEMAISSSQHDPRFPNVSEGEMQEIDIEISVLSPLCEIQDVSEIEVGRHGINITREFSSGVLLPQVATEQGWDRDTFLAHTCLKAGLPQDAWKQKDTKIEIFEAQIFSEKND